MLNSLSSFVFGRSEQNDAGGSRDDARAQVSQGMDLKTKEEDLGWLLVDMAGGSSPSEPQAQEEKDPSLRRPDGSLFDGVLDGLSSCSESCSLSDVEEAEENNNTLVQHPSPCPSSSDKSDGEEFMGDIVAQPHPSHCDSSGENDSPLDAFFVPFGESDEENDNHVDLPSLASSCSSLSVIMEWDEDDLLNRFQSPMSKSGGMDKLTDSWMVTPPPCFTGTQVNNEQLQSSPLENKLIEYTSMYACLMMNEDLLHPPYLVDKRPPRRHLPDDYEIICRLLPDSESKYKRRNQPVTLRQERRNNIRRALVALQTSSQAAAAAAAAERASAAQARLQLIRQQAARPVTAVRECASMAEMKKQAHLQQCHQKAAAKKFFSRGCFERSNKAKMVESSSRKQTSARNRCLKPSGSKCGRFCQRTQ